MHSRYTELHTLLKTALPHIEPHLDEQELRDLEDLLEAREFGVALEMIIAVILEENIAPASTLHAALEKAAYLMGMSHVTQKLKSPFM